MAEYVPIPTALTEEEAALRKAYDNFIAQVQANPSAYTPQELASYIGTRFGSSTGLSNTVSPQEYLGTLENIYGAGETWDSLYGSPSQDKASGPTAAELAAMLTEHKQKKAQIEQAYQDGLIDWRTKNTALEDERNSLIGQKDQGLQSNSAYFSNVSPDAFQSQMGNYNQKVLDAYTQGEKTIQNNQASIDYYKQQTENNYQANKNYIDTYNAATGKYDESAYVAPGVVKAPTINAVTANPLAQAAKLGVPSWAPNYGGLSTMQAKTKEDDSISKYLGA